MSLRMTAVMMTLKGLPFCSEARRRSRRMTGLCLDGHEGSHVEGVCEWWEAAGRDVAGCAGDLPLSLLMGAKS